ncbi:MAG TPA: methyltransferase, TIGR04325 family [Polyangiaceae bacterium]
MINFAALIKRKLMQRTPANGCYGVFNDFEAAEASARRHLPVGYDAADTGSWYRDMMERVQHDEYPMLYWFEKTLPTSRTVVEIGGHVGVAFYSFATRVKFPADLKWTIVDVPTVTRAGEDLALQRGETRLQFCNEFSAMLAPMDLLMASGSLQYVPGPLLPSRLLAMQQRPTHIIIHKTPVIAQPKGYVTLQNISAAWCPYRIFGFGELIEPLLDLGYELVDSWAKERVINIPRRPDLRVTHYSGYYLRTKVT